MKTLFKLLSGFIIALLLMNFKKATAMNNASKNTNSVNTDTLKGVEQKDLNVVGSKILVKDDANVNQNISSSCCCC